jgi:hypothetical protein
MSYNDMQSLNMTDFNKIISNNLNNKVDIKKEFIIRLIKLFDIAYIFSLYVLGAFIQSLILSSLFKDFNKEEYDKKSSIKIFIEICLIFACIGILVYFTKNLLEHIPFPLDGYKGYNHSRLKEINTAIPLTYTILFFQRGLRKKLGVLAKRFM